MLKTGCRLIDVEYEERCPPGGHDGTGSGTPRPSSIWPKAGGNVLVPGQEFLWGDVDQAFADADRVIGQTFEQHRISNQPAGDSRHRRRDRPVTGELILHSGHPVRSHPVGHSPPGWATNPSGSHFGKLATNREHTRSSPQAPAPISLPTRRSSAQVSR